MRRAKIPAICVQVTVTPSPSMTSELRSFIRLALSLVAGVFLPCVYVILVILPVIGERLIWTSSGERNTLTSLPFSLVSILVTRPSAAETIRPSPVGTSRCGSRKKYIINSATAANTTTTGHSANHPNIAAITTGTNTKGIPSRTIKINVNTITDS